MLLPAEAGAFSLVEAGEVPVEVDRPLMENELLLMRAVLSLIEVNIRLGGSDVLSMESSVLVIVAEAFSKRGKRA